jgi:hypothetical protein
MMEQDEQAHVGRIGQPNRERERASQSYLAVLDQLEDDFIWAEDDRQRRKLQRENAAVRRAFAQHLGEETYIDKLRSRAVIPIWFVGKVPSRKHKEAAREWMRQRGLDWDGSAPRLRNEVRRALQENQPIPEGKFGLHVERTVDIRNPREFTFNLLGKPHYILPHVERPKSNIKRDVFALTFYPEED